jgi:hypothetical protein
MVKKTPAPQHIDANFENIHERGLAAGTGLQQHGREVTHGPRGPPLPTLTALELEQHVSVERAAEILCIHAETFEAAYPHLIRRVSPRCRRVKLRDLISVQTVEAA